MKFIPTTSRGVMAAVAAFIALSGCGGGGDGGADEVAKPPASIGAGDPSPGDTGTPAADVPVSFAVDGRLKLVGLGFTFEAFPVVLFADRRALTDTVGLLFPAGLAAHRVQYPGTWTQWRPSGANVEIQQADGSWKTITATNVAPMASGEFTVSGIYESLSVGFSPSMSIASSSQYTFTQAGAIGKGGYVLGDTATVGAIATTPDRRGTYSIDGHRLTITLENGTVEEHVIVFKESDANSMFIDGAMYSLRAPSVR